MIFSQKFFFFFFPEIFFVTISEEGSAGGAAASPPSPMGTVLGVWGHRVWVQQGSPSPLLPLVLHMPQGL